MDNEWRPCMERALSSVEIISISPLMARGGKRAGAGRKPGVPNKASRELKELAREYTEEAVGALVRVLRDKEAPASAQVAAATAILDRGHGKPTQHIDAEHAGSIAHRIMQMTPEERARDAVDLVQRARQRLAEYRMTIEHQRAAEPEADEDG